MSNKPAPTLYAAVGGFLGPLLADCCRLVDECSDDAEVIVKVAGYSHKTTLKTIKDLDRAYAAAHEAKLKRDDKKRVGTLL